MGAADITFQICLPDEHMSTGGAYRGDEAYLSLVASRIARLQEICFRECAALPRAHAVSRLCAFTALARARLFVVGHGLNFYVETHIDRISEDVEGFCKIMDRAPYFEINADISHYNYRGITKGAFLERINARVNHTHQRMARAHGEPGVSTLYTVYFD